MSLELTDLFGGIGNVITIIFFFLPSYMMIELCKTKDSSKIPWLLFIFTILNCEFWMIYGIKLNAWPIYVSNGVGIVTNTIYITIFLICLKDEELWKRIFLIFIIYGTFLLTFFAFVTYSLDIKLIGGIALVMNMLLYAAPLQKLSEVFIKKDNSYINIWIALCLSLNSFTWFSYGFFKSRDYFIMIPNLFGFILNLFQIYIWLKYKKEYDGKIKFKNDTNTGSDEELNIEQEKETNNNEADKMEEGHRKFYEQENFEKSEGVNKNLEKVEILQSKKNVYNISDN